MLISEQISLDLLRLYVAVCRQGSLSKAAHLRGRTQSAVSMQMRRLEDLIGRRLFHRTGRGVVPTSDGELFLGYATRILALGDEAQARLGLPEMTGGVRIGLSEEVAAGALPAALGQLQRSCPDIQLDVTVDHSLALGEAWQANRFDILVAPASVVQEEARTIWSVDLLWACALDYLADRNRPLNLIAFSAPCLWRQKMIDALAASGRPYRIAFSSQSLSALRAAVENGLGVGLLPPDHVRAGYSRPADAKEAPAPITVQYGLYLRDNPSPCIEAVVDILRQAVSPGHLQD